MPTKRKSQTTISDFFSKKVKVEVPNCFQFISENITKEISAYLSLKDLYHFKLACKYINSSVKISKPIQITKKNFELACKTPGYHFIKLKGDDGMVQDFVNDYGIFKEIKYIDVTDLVIDFGGEKKNDRFFKNAVGTLFPNLKSLKFIRCAQDVDIMLPRCLTNLTTLEIYTSGCITLTGDHKVENVRLCSTHDSFGKPATIEVLSWDICDMEHGKNYKYHAKTIILNVHVSMSEKRFDFFGPRADFVPNPNFL